MVLKFKQIRLKHRPHSENEAVEDTKADETLTDIISSIQEEHFSDLQPEDIPDDHVDEVSENDIDISSLLENETY